MQKSILALLMLFGGGFAPLGLPQKRPVKFSLVVGSCFTEDTVNLAINGQPLIVGALAKSDSNSGVAAISVHQDANGLWVQMQKHKTQVSRLDLQREVMLDIQVNGQQTTKVVDLRRGWILFLDYCYESEPAGAAVRKVTVRQYKKAVTLY